MGRIQLRISPLLASLLKNQSSGWLSLDKEIGDDTTIGDVLTDLASVNKSSRTAVFDSESGETSDQLMIMLNDTVQQLPDAIKIKLNSGDRVLLTTIFSGG
ncbi:MAG: hypothetical protein V1894_00335 [Chloroflexota bacterium]